MLLQSFLDLLQPFRELGREFSSDLTLTSSSFFDSGGYIFSKLLEVRAPEFLDSRFGKRFERAHDSKANCQRFFLARQPGNRLWEFRIVNPPILV